MINLLFALLLVTGVGSSHGCSDPVKMPDKGNGGLLEQILPAKKAGDIRIMQYNIRYGVGMDGKYDIDRIADVMTNSKADIFILNEVDKYYSARSLNMYMAEYLAEKLGMNFVHRSSIIVGNPGGADREVGNAILTKYGLEHIETLFFSKGDQYPRVITKTKVTLDGGREIYVATSHYGLIEENRVIQANETIEFLSGVNDKPVIFSGDLNALPDTEEIGILNAHYTDAFAAKNNYYTFPANKPVKRIDYIFGNDKVTFRDNAMVLETQASDHLPIIVDITF